MVRTFLQYAAFWSTLVLMKLSKNGLVRSITPHILKDLDTKIVLLSGPRQVGKTFLSRQLFPTSSVYLNYDNHDSRRTLRNRDWPRDEALLVLDELHKMPSWKRWIKGLYDVEGTRPRLLVTGSARLDIHRRGGDSLAGRHHLYRLHPLSLSELSRAESPRRAELSRVESLRADSFSKLLRRGGFPEAYLAATDEEAARWRKSHLDRILKEDLIELEQVRNLKGVEVLVDLLSERVGAPISYMSLARDLEVSPHTVKKWIQILESLFIVFIVPPYSKNIAKALLKEPKIYFYDTGRVQGDDGMRFENLVACALLKRNHFLEDVKGATHGLYYVRDKEKREVDFLVTQGSKVEFLVEAKWADNALSTSLLYFAEKLKVPTAWQLVAHSRIKKQIGVSRLTPAVDWLSGLES